MPPEAPAAPPNSFSSTSHNISIQMCQNKQPNKRATKSKGREVEQQREERRAEEGQRDFLTNFYDTFHFMTPGQLYVLRSANFKVDFSFRHFLFFFTCALRFLSPQGGGNNYKTHIPQPSPQSTPPMTIKNNKCQKLLLSLAL